MCILKCSDLAYTLGQRHLGSPSKAFLYYGVKEGEDAAIAKVRLSGACESCAMSAQTLRMGIERHLTQTFPEIVGVIQVL